MTRNNKNQYGNCYALIDNMIDAFAVHEIILNKNGEPVNYRFVEVNHEFLDRMGMEEEEVVNKTALDLFPDTELKWIHEFGEVALNGQPKRFVNYSKEFDRYYDTSVYSPKKGYFAAVFSDITELKKSQLELEQTNKKLQVANIELNQIFENTPFTQLLLNKHRQVLRINNENIDPIYKNGKIATYPGNLLHCIHAVGEGKICGFVDACDDCFTKGVYDKTVSTGQNQTNEGSVFLLMNGKESKRYVNMSTTIYYTPENEQRVLINLYDITDRKKAELQLQESEYRYRQLFEESTDPLFIMRGDTIIDCNKAALNELKYKNKADLISQKLWDFSPELQPDGRSSKEKAKELIAKAEKNVSIKFEWIHKTKLNEELWYDVSLIKIVEQNEEKTFVTFRNITSKKEADIKLERNEKRLRKVFENAQVGITITKNRELNYINPFLAKMLGYQVNDLMGKNARILYPSVKDYEVLGEKKFRILDEQGTVTVETRFLNSNGDILNVLMNSSFLDNDNRKEGIVSIIADVTSQKVFEESLKRKNKEKDIFISVIAHDLKNSLSANVQLVELLNSGKLDSTKRDKFLNHLEVNFKKSSDLLDSLVKWGKASQNREQFTTILLNPHHLVENLKDFFQAELSNKSLIIENNIKPDLKIQADKDMLDFILRNLVNNAIKYTLKNGNIKINCEMKGAFCECCVSDSGVGISQERIKKLFSLEPIQSEPGTDGEEGHGLGLQIIKEYVRLHKGRIWAESKVGEGTEIFFTIANQ